MATLCIRDGKTVGYEIQFFDANGRRLTIYLGGRRYNERTANELKNVVESLIYSRDNSLSMLDKRSLAWLQTASQEIREKLRRAGLIEITPTHTLKELWDAAISQKDDIKEATRDQYFYVRERFFRFFKEG